MYFHRNLDINDLESICSFPQTPEELFFMSPRFIYPLTPDQILNLLKDRYEPKVIINKQNLEVVAYANMYKDEVGSLWLGNVIVSPKYRGKAASHYLIEVMLNKAKYNLKRKSIKLSCHSMNATGLAFYSKHGFKPFDIKVSTIKDHKFITIHMYKDIM